MRKLVPLLLIAVSITNARAQDRGTLLHACADDLRTLCSGVTPGGGRIKQCMIETFDRLSDGCRTALKDAKARQAGN